MIQSSPATAKRRRAETKVIKAVREVVSARDGWCRVACKGVGSCQGDSEWAHWGEWRRSLTRRMDPAVRHRTEITLMLCVRHHRAYDLHQFEIEPVTDRGCDGEIQVIVGVEIVGSETGGRHGG